VAISHVWREQNRRADQLCNDALDGRMTGAGPALPQTGTGTQGRPDGLRDKVAAILKEAAASWAEGNPDNPDPISVAERICGVLKESDLRE
jgi:hypothetical protein